MWKNLSIRFKITVLNTVLLTVISFFLYTVSNISTTNIINTIPLTAVTPNSEQIQPLDEITQILPSIEIQGAAKNTHRNTMAIWLVVAVIFGSCTSYIITKHTLKPLNDFSKNISDMNIKKLSDTIEIKNADYEISSLVNAFNDMTKRLNYEFEMQSNFSHNISHELKTPLTVIKTKIDIFYKRKNQDIKNYEDLFFVLREYNDRLFKMIDGILKYSNFSETALDANVSIDDIFTKVIDEQKHLYKDTEIEYKSNNINIAGNQLLLYRVFSNIVENACRYNNENEKIIISTQKSKSEIIIEIADNGIGISKENKENIFNPFFTVDKSRSKEFGGVGLGLFFCKQILEKHNANIYVKDNIPKGSVFVVIFPLNIDLT